MYYSLGQMFGEPKYGMLLPPSYQEGPYAATGQIYRDPNFTSYQQPGAWRSLYEGLFPAEMTPRTSMEIYGKANLGTQWWRLLYANKANLDDLKATMNKEVMIQYKKDMQAKVKKLEAAEKKETDEKAKLVLAQKKKELQDEMKKGLEEGKNLVKQQEQASKLAAERSITGGEMNIEMFGLGFRPDYRIVMPPAMQGKLMDIVGEKSLGGLSAPVKFGGVALALLAAGYFLMK